MRGAIILTLFPILVFSQDTPEQLILGVWISEGRSYASRWEFGENGLIHDFEKNTIDASYNYSISTLNPDCGNMADPNRSKLFLKMTDIENSSLTLCYEVSVLNDSTLTLVYLGGVSIKPTVFRRHENKVIKDF